MWVRAGVKATKPAAVLVPVIDRPEPTVLLTLRTAELASHAGQVAFPGGKIDPTDESPVAAALREAKEETGLAPNLIEPIGYLDLYLTFSGFRILPTVARVKPDFTLTLNPREVVETFEVPLAFVMTSDNHQRKTRDWNGTAARLLRHPVREPLHLGHHRGYSPEPLRPGLRRMIRPVFTEIGLFLTPFVLYAAFLLATRAGVLAPSAWTMPASGGSGYRIARSRDRKFFDIGAIYRRAAGRHLRAGAYRKRQAGAGSDAVTDNRQLGDAPWLRHGEVARLLDVLGRDGEEARVVGGAVRNALLSLAVDEIDVATTAVPDDVVRRVEAAGWKAVPTGIDHGTVTVVIDGKPFEVTTLRAGRRDLRPQGQGGIRPRLADRRRAARFHHQCAVGVCGRPDTRLCRRHRRYRGAARAFHRRAGDADRRRLSAHPAVFPLSRPVRQRRIPTPRDYTPASLRAPASRRCRASGCGWSF